MILRSLLQPATKVWVLTLYFIVIGLVVYALHERSTVEHLTRTVDHEQPILRFLEGPNGLSGHRGPTGSTGAAGQQGPAGPRGTRGGPGIAGPRGLGPSGPQGGSGEPGSNGERGTQGPRGLQGPTGRPGPAGAQGLAGVTVTVQQVLTGLCKDAPQVCSLLHIPTN